MLLQHVITCAPLQYRHCHMKQSRKEDVFVDHVKQGLPKIFLIEHDHTSKSASKPTAPSSLYIPRLVPNTYGFCMKYSLQFITYSLQCECSYDYAIGKLKHNIFRT